MLLLFNTLVSIDGYNYYSATEGSPALWHSGSLDSGSHISHLTSHRKFCTYFLVYTHLYHRYDFYLLFALTDAH